MERKHVLYIDGGAHGSKGYADVQLTDAGYQLTWSADLRKGIRGEKEELYDTFEEAALRALAVIIRGQAGQA